jgi:hypothetical protein
VLSSSTRLSSRHYRSSECLRAMSRHGALIVVGSGPGVGSHVAASFARQGFRRVILMSRDTRRLSDDAMVIKSVAPATVIDVIAVDLAQTEHVEAALEEVRRRLAGIPPECIFSTPRGRERVSCLNGPWKTSSGIAWHTHGNSFARTFRV